MNSYNHFEKHIAGILSYLPGIKNILKRIYQFINYVFYRKKYNYHSINNICPVSNYNYETFFGYYDKSPENDCGEYTIFQRTSLSTKRKPSPKKSLEIILMNNKTEIENVIGKSSSYNWQQGTKLQWVSNNEFIYNFFDKKDNSYKSKIVNAITQNVMGVIDYPVYDCFKNEYALSLNFNRLNKLRPDYGYRNLNSIIDFLDNSKDGIFKVNFSNNSSKLILTLNDVIEFSPLKSMKNAKHKINHIMISPDGDKFIFMHRWFMKGGKKFDRLFVCDINGQNLKLLSDEGMVSHCCWYSNNEIIGYLKDNSYGANYYKIDVISGIKKLLSKKLLKFGDGHPSVFNNKMIFDSYPDRSRMKHLFIYDIKNDKIQEIGQFYESIKYFGETRCDLHPKWNYKGNKIFIDSVHEGKRKLYEIKL